MQLKHVICHEQLLKEVHYGGMRRMGMAVGTSLPPSPSHGDAAIAWKVLGLEGALGLLTEGATPCFQPFLYEFVGIFHKYTMDGSICDLELLHAYMCLNGLEFHRSVSNYLVIMFVDAGNMRRAQQVFDKLVYIDEFTWSSLITGYVKYGEPDRSLLVHERMQECGTYNLTGHAFVAMLKACSALKDLERGRRLHNEIAHLGFLKKDVFIGSNLVFMYAKCGQLFKAQEVFNNLTLRDVVSWNTLLAAYTEHGCPEKALCCFEQMKKESISPSSTTFVCSLSACSSLESIEKTQEIHANAVEMGLERELFVGNALIDSYAKCGFPDQANDVFNKIAARDVVSWTALICGYADNGYLEDAFYFMQQMQQEGISQNAVTFVCILKACSRLQLVEKGQDVYGDIVKKGLEGELLIGNTLVDMYAKCGLLETAHTLFGMLIDPDEVSWTSLISGYVENGLEEDALKCVEHMQQQGIPWNAFTLCSSLKACGIVGAVKEGIKIHMEIVYQGLETETHVSNMLLEMYARCGLLSASEAVFHNLSNRSIVSWTVLIAGYIEHEQYENAMHCLDKIQEVGIPLNEGIYTFSLKLSSILDEKMKGQAIHTDIITKGFELELHISSALIYMYVKFSSLAEARYILSTLPSPNVVCWNTVIGGYADQGQNVDVFNCFKQMQDGGVAPDSSTFIYILKVCGRTGVAAVHSEATKAGFDSECIFGNSLIHAYAKYSYVAEAQHVFANVQSQDIVSWNSLISAYADNELNEEVLNKFQEMQEKKLPLSTVTIGCILKACGNTGSTVRGREIHSYSTRIGLDGEAVIGNILVDMYSKFGLLSEAQNVFYKLYVKDDISWNALIAGHAQTGECGNAFQIFNSMLEESKPDQVTLISMLNACSHAGLVDTGRALFESIDRYGFIPILEHYTCMVDLLGRAGCVEKAIELICKMPFHPHILLWHTILGACRKWGDVDIGRHAFEHAVDLNHNHPSAYVYMSNIFADIHACNIGG